MYAVCIEWIYNELLQRVHLDTLCLVYYLKNAVRTNLGIECAEHLHVVHGMPKMCALRAGKSENLYVNPVCVYI